MQSRCKENRLFDQRAMKIDINQEFDEETSYKLRQQREKKIKKKKEL